MRIPHPTNYFTLKILLKNNHTVQEILAEHVLSTAEAYEFELVLINAFSNQSIVNHLSTLFRQLLVPRSTTRSLVSITGNFVLLVRISLQDLSSQLNVHLAVVIQTSATNLEEDCTRAGYLDFLDNFSNLGLNICQSILCIGQISLSLFKFASILVDFIIQSIHIYLRYIRNELLTAEGISCTGTYIDSTNSLGCRQVTQVRRSQFATSLNVNIPILVDIELTLQTNRTVYIHTTLLVTGRNASPRIAVFSILNHTISRLGKRKTRTSKYGQIEHTIRIVTPNGIGEVIHSIQTELAYILVIAGRLAHRQTIGIKGTIRMLCIKVGLPQTTLGTHTPNRSEPLTQRHCDMRSRATELAFALTGIYHGNTASHAHKDIVCGLFVDVFLFCLSIYSHCCTCQQ